jgi:hypothetical protein
MDFTFQSSREDFTDNLPLFSRFLFRRIRIAQDIRLFDRHASNLIDIALIINKAVQWNAHRSTLVPKDGNNTTLYHRDFP